MTAWGQGPCLWNVPFMFSFWLPKGIGKYLLNKWQKTWAMLNFSCSPNRHMQKAGRMWIWSSGEGKGYRFAMGLFPAVGRFGSEPSSTRTTCRTEREVWGQNLGQRLHRQLTPRSDPGQRPHSQFLQRSEPWTAHPIPRRSQHPGQRTPHSRRGRDPGQRPHRPLYAEARTLDSAHVSKFYTAGRYPAHWLIQKSVWKPHHQKNLLNHVNKFVMGRYFRTKLL